MICIIASLREFKRANECRGYAKSMSIITLMLNSTWNYVIFIWQLIIDVQGFDMNIPLVLSTMSVFFYINIFQMQMFIYIWRSRVTEYTESTPISLLKFNFKIYILILLTAFFIVNVITIPYIIFFFLSILWLPQIIRNMVNSFNGSPSAFYIIAITCQHLYAPVLLLLTTSYT